MSLLRSLIPAVDEPLRHSAVQLYKRTSVKMDTADQPVLVIVSDGGPDHRITFVVGNGCPVPRVGLGYACMCQNMPLSKLVECRRKSDVHT